MMIHSLLVAYIVVLADAALPPGHESFLNEFGGMIRCPHASDWLRKGPEQAAQDIANHHRLLQEGPPAWVLESPSGPPPVCEIAPGPAGAAHQAAYSIGYKNCTGTPAEGSPYMWPEAWSAKIESESMPFGSDAVGFHSRGQVWYRLDRNWKRADTFYQRGIQRSIGQGPCDPENVVSAPGEPVIACRRNSDERKTMLHRGSKMYFITWKNETEGDDVANIDTCRWLDLAIVGNVRPDWYLDKRGESTDVQYLGKQHVYHHNSTPRLVKQWRKEDFADQYFTMSMQENLLEDGIHWPLILNVPGEGFGDDFLQKYTDHFLLTDDDNALFLLDEALVAANGTCPQMASSGSGGPPVGEVEPIPSDLVVEPEAWFSNEITFSPVWQPPLEIGAPPSNAGETDGPAITETPFGFVTSCYDESSGAINLSFTFQDVSTDDDDLPWVALGYRPTKECLMTPRGGGDTELIFISSSTASLGSLSPSAKRFDGTAFSSLMSSLSPLEDADSYANVELVIPSDSLGALELSFAQTMETPQLMNMMFAIGSSPEIGYHSSRDCFQLTEFPTCSAKEQSAEPSVLSNASSSSLYSGAFVAFLASVMTVLTLVP